MKPSDQSKESLLLFFFSLKKSLHKRNLGIIFLRNLNSILARYPKVHDNNQQKFKLFFKTKLKQGTFKGVKILNHLKTYNKNIFLAKWKKIFQIEIEIRTCTDHIPVIAFLKMSKSTIFFFYFLIYVVYDKQQCQSRKKKKCY